jgi:hypothetical protein
MYEKYYDNKKIIKKKIYFLFVCFLMIKKTHIHTKHYAMPGKKGSDSKKMGLNLNYNYTSTIPYSK